MFLLLNEKIEEEKEEVYVLLELPVYGITTPPRRQQHHFHHRVICNLASKIWFNTMASRFFGSSSSSIDLIVTNTPSTELALTNLAFCSASDLPKFAIPGHSNLHLASIGDSFVFSLQYPSPLNFMTFLIILFCFRISCDVRFTSVGLIVVFNLSQCLIIFGNLCLDL